MKQYVYRLLAPRHGRRAVKLLRLLERRLPSQPMRLGVPFAFKARGLFKSIRPRQNPTEIETLYRRLCEIAPRTVLEIGTAKGGTLYLWTQAAAPDAVLVSVDMPGGAFGGGYPEERKPLYEAFARPGQTLHLLRADSHAPETLAEVRARFGGEPIDFAFIDGDHTYEGVRADFEEYGPLVRPGGFIAFHDILPQPDSPQTQVHELWNEIHDAYESWELIDTSEDGKERIGIGVLRVPEAGLRARA